MLKVKSPPITQVFVTSINLFHQTDALGKLELIKSILKAGGIIAVPTDTIYGLACLACNTSSLKKIYSIKGRDASKPLAICVGNIDDLAKWVSKLDQTKTQY